MRHAVASDLDPGEFFWNIAGRAGHRVAALDVPYAVVDECQAGVQIAEWGTHDPAFGFSCHPRDLLQDIRARYGDHPVSAKHGGRCDRYPKNDAGYLELLNDLLLGIEKRTKLFMDMMEGSAWDLYVCGYSEAHCAGHHFLHSHESQEETIAQGSERQRLREGLRSVYRAIDASVGRLIAAAGKGCTTMVFAPQGMTRFTGGAQLLPEILARLGLASDAGARRNSAIRKTQTFIRRRAPSSLLPLLHKLAAVGAVKSVQSRAGCLRDPFESPRTRAASVPNNRIGAVRLNLRGREPFGSVSPGEEAQRLLSELRDALLELRSSRTEQTIVQRVMMAEEVFGADYHPDLPDLLVEFRTDIGPIEECYSHRVGKISGPFDKAFNRRTGDHTTNATLWTIGPDVPAGMELPQSSVLDIAPTVLRLLRVGLPNALDGRPIGALCKSV